MSLADIDHFVALITVDNVQGFMNEMDYLEKAVDRRHLNDPGAYMKSVLTTYFSSLEDLSQEVVLLPAQDRN